MDDRERTARTPSHKADSVASDAHRASSRKSLRLEERLASLDEALRSESPSGTGSLRVSDTGTLRKTDTGTLRVTTPSASDTGAMSAAASAPSTAASNTGSLPHAAETATADAAQPQSKPRSAGSSSTPRYVRRRTPHRSQGAIDDLNDNSIPSASYTHDSNITVGGATPLSGMAYRRARSNMSRVHNSTRYGQYLEIPKGRRSIFASRERARRRKSVLALLAVVALLVLAAYFLWNMMQNILN